jgi:hypothetical protein
MRRGPCEHHGAYRPQPGAAVEGWLHHAYGARESIGLTHTYSDTYFGTSFASRQREYFAG